MAAVNMLLAIAAMLAGDVQPDQIRSLHDVGAMVVRCYHPSATYTGIEVLERPWSKGAQWKADTSAVLKVSYRGKPIVLDLDGDGVELTSAFGSTALFDINADGELDQMGWAAADDGLLAYDVDGDGVINQRAEIAFIDYIEGAMTDLEGLRYFDSNQDGVLNAQDAGWDKFGVWQDADQDGQTDAGEFKSLDAMGIAEIGLTSDGNLRADQGNVVFGEGSYTRTDGSTEALADVMFEYIDGRTGQPAMADPGVSGIVMADDVAAQLAALRQLMAAMPPAEGNLAPADPSAGGGDYQLAGDAMNTDPADPQNQNGGGGD